MRKYTLLYFVIAILSSCAIRVNPTGGDKDIVPPKVLNTIPENFSVNVKTNDIVITFDEFIQLNDINTQLVVSPLLKYTPETVVRKKSLHIHFTDTLEANTTYTMNFGNSITDNNEGNALENYQFVFSTGNVVDSLKISGRIENGFDQKKEKGILAMIYRENDDSLPFNKRPMYFAKTNDAGEFVINNIAPGDYKLVALDDKDKNYLYTNGEESIGFSEERISAGNVNVFVRLFKEPAPLHLIKSASISPGKVYLVFSAPADTVKLNFLTDLKKMDIFSQEFSKDKDTLTILYKNADLDSLSFTYFNGKKMDTVDVRLFKKSNKVASRANFEFVLTAVDRNASHHFYMPYKINSNHPLVSIDPSGIVLMKDSIEEKDFKVVFADSMKNSFEVAAKWSDKYLYKLFIPPGSIEDIYGLKNDTLKFEWTVKPESFYGTMLLKLTSVTDNIIVQLLDNTDNLYRETNVSSDTSIQYTFLDPMLYKIKIVHDKNGNNKWDSGDLLKHIQPEIVEFNPELITVRANWDVDVKWDLNYKKPVLK